MRAHRLTCRATWARPIATSRTLPLVNKLASIREHRIAHESPNFVASCSSPHTCRISKITGFATERTKPFPITEIDFSRNEITGEGIGAVVQFARTQGADASIVDLSHNKIDDQSASDEVTRLVKVYSSFAANAFISTLLLSGNSIGREGAHQQVSRQSCSALRSTS